MRTETPIKLSRLLAQIAPNKVFAAIVLGLMAGLAYALIIPLVLWSLGYVDTPDSDSRPQELVTVLSVQIRTPRFALAFLVVCLFILATRSLSTILLNRAALAAARDLRRQLYSRIARAPIEYLERLGPTKIVATIATDVPRLVTGATTLPNMLMSGASIAGLLIFLAYLDGRVFWFAVIAMVFGIVTYTIPMMFAKRFIGRARECLARIQDGCRGLVSGAKELRLNRTRRAAFIEEELLARENVLAGHQYRGMAIAVLAVGYGDLICFFAIGILTYAVATLYSLSGQDLTGVVMAMLYITGPIGVILNGLLPYAEASVAAQRLQALLKELPPEPVNEAAGRIDCESIRLEGVRYRYSTEDGSFCIGPIDLSLNRGEVTFIVGGNGSGKTTLGKIVSLHYFPEQGRLYWDDAAVTELNRDACRQSVSAIYSDFHLFTRLFGAQDDARQQLAQSHLAALGLEEKVRIEAGCLSTVSLSDGQRKRLALLSAYLEDRNIYVFDEWAADQDPKFKHVFYAQILPELRRAGKLVVVISHDDRYFHLADRIVRMESGRLISVERNSDAKLAC